MAVGACRSGRPSRAQQPARQTALARPLLRPQATAAHADVFSEVSVLAPATLSVAASTACAAAAMLLLAALLIEVPDRVAAVGVLVPEAGVVRLGAPADGVVTAIHVTAGDSVLAGQPLAGIGRDAAGAASLSLTAVRRRTLDAERATLETIDARREMMRRERRAAFEAEQAHLAQNREWAVERLRVLAQSAALLERRAERLAALGETGSVAAERVDAARGEWLEARRAWLDGRTAVADLEISAARHGTELANIEAEADIRTLENHARRQALDRRSAEAAVDGQRELRAPIAGRVLRIAVARGDSVAAGAPVATLLPVGAVLEARLYVPARVAARLEIGQDVELRFDAMPHQHFGTARARITAIGNVAILPAELHRIVNLAEPVFEVRANLPTGFEREFVPQILPGIGASFRADIVRQRQNLVGWLLRALSRGKTDGRAHGR